MSWQLTDGFCGPVRGQGVLSQRLKEPRYAVAELAPAARRSLGEWHPDLLPTPRPCCLIELRAMDRETARRNMRAGLIAGGIAAGIFALTFVAAFLYIAQ